MSPPAVAPNGNATWWGKDRTMTSGQQVLFPTSVELRLTVDPPEDVEGGPQIQVRGQGVPKESHPHCGALRLED